MSAKPGSPQLSAARRALPAANSLRRSGARQTVVVVVACLLLTTAASVAVGSVEAIALLIAIIAGIAAAAVAIVRPMSLLYFYCAAIPFNFVLPPGPAGTVARIAGVAFFIGYIVREPDSVRLNSVPVVGWLFLIWALASTQWAVSAQTTVADWVSMAQLFAITVLIASLVAKRPGIVRRGLWSYSISASVTAAIGIYSYLQSPEVFLGRAAAFQNQDPALFASLLIPAIIFQMGEVQARGVRVPVRAFAAAGLIVCVIAIALSGTRSAWLGIFAATIGWLILQRDPRQVLAATGVALGVLLLVLVEPSAANFLSERVGKDLATGAGRTDIWAVGLGILALTPIVGVGFGNFPVAFTPAAVAEAASAAAAQGTAIGVGRAPHNILLGTTVELGLIGGALLIAFLAAALWGSNRDHLADVVRVALVGLLVQSMFLDTLLQKQLWLMLAFAFGLSAARRIAAPTRAAAAAPASWPPAEAAASRR